MSDYISREERESAIEYLSNISENFIDYSGKLPEPLPEYFAIETAIKMLSADVRENIHSTWIDDGNGFFICDKCGEKSCCNANYCCECGADMRGK